MNAAFLSADRFVACASCRLFAMAAGAHTGSFESQEKFFSGEAGAEHTPGDRTANDQIGPIKFSASGAQTPLEAVVTRGRFDEGRGVRPYARPDNLPSPAKLIDIVIKSGNTRGYAHGDDVVHRDIKPANIAYALGADKTLLNPVSERAAPRTQVTNDLRACVPSLAS